MPSMCFDDFRPCTNESPLHYEQPVVAEPALKDTPTKFAVTWAAQQPREAFSDLSHLSSTPSFPIPMLLDIFDSPELPRHMVSTDSAQSEPYLLASVKQEKSSQLRHDSVPPSSSFSKPDLDNFSKVPDLLRCRSDGCSAAYSGAYRKSNLARHTKLKHKDAVAMRYVCADKTCNRAFKRQDARLKHYRQQHPYLSKWISARVTVVHSDRAL